MSCRPSGDQNGFPYSPSRRRSDPSAFISHTPLGSPLTFDRNAMRSSFGEKAGQLPGPRSVTFKRPSRRSIDCNRVR